MSEATSEKYSKREPATKRSVYKKRGYVDVNIPTNDSSLSPHKHTENDGLISDANLTSSEMLCDSALVQAPNTNQAVKEFWSLSDHSCGRFLPSEPIITYDEEFAILANRRRVIVYSLESSTEKARFAYLDAQMITHLIPSSASEPLVFCATSSRNISAWNWRSSLCLATHSLGQRIHAISSHFINRDNIEQLVVLSRTDGKKKAPSFQLQLINFHHDTLKFSPQNNVIFTLNKRINFLRSSANGSIYFIADEMLIIGIQSREQETSFIWWKFTLNFTVTALDLNVPTSEGVHDLTSLLKENLALGSSRGEIYVYYDILNKIQNLDSNDNCTPHDYLKPKKMHWHRGMVNSIKWSNDGYLYSGGNETVLVIWQLATGKRSMLPHLLSGIESLTISRQGSLIGVKLVDNIFMVLSTGEFSPIAYISGMQVEGIPVEATRRIYEEAISQTHEGKSNIDRMIVKYTHKLPGRIQLIVPWTINAKGGSYLQIFDVDNEAHIVKQALTWNHATNANSKPFSNEKLCEPTVNFMEVTHDGTWMITTEEWSSPPEDVKYLLRAVKNIEQQSREVVMKFWQWCDDKDEWELNTLVNGPHDSSMYDFNGRVLDVKVDPTKHCFVSVGEDNSIKWWKTKVKGHRDFCHTNDNKSGSSGGLSSHNQCLDNPDRQLQWVCSNVVGLKRGNFHLGHDSTKDPFTDILRSRLAFSSDGSVVAVSQEFTSQTELAAKSLVYLINAKTAKICHVEVGMYTQALSDIAFMGRYLIILACELVLWDTVTGEKIFTVKTTHITRMNSSTWVKWSHLAVNDAESIFAIALPVKCLGNKTIFSEVIVFRISPGKITVQARSTGLITALLSVGKKDNFLIINGYAEAQSIRIDGTSSENSHLPTHRVSTWNEISGFKSSNDICHTNAEVEEPSIDQYDSEKLITTDALGEIFREHANVLPSVSLVFERFMHLYSD